MRIVLGMLFSALLMSQPAWHSIKDKTGSCQLSLPPNWTILPLPGHASSPDHMGTTLISGQRPYRPFSEETLRVLHPDTVFENSPKRSFYAKKVPNATAVSYHIEVPGSANACVAEIGATPSYSLDEIKKIALTLSAAK
jgi:hypothetical protein